MTDRGRAARPPALARRRLGRAAVRIAGPLALASWLGSGLGSGFAHAREPATTEADVSADSPSPATPTVLILPIVGDGLANADQRGLLARLTAAFDHEQLAQVEIADHQPCADEPCLRELGRANAASHVVQVRVEADGRDYTASLTVVTVAATGPADIIDAGCEICGLAEFEDRLAARAVAARDLILAAPRVGRVELVGAPAEARVRIDGRLRGRLPLVAELPVGDHELRVRADGYYPELLPVESRAGVTQRLEIGLEPKPLTRWQRPTGWTLVGLGATSLTAGFALIGVHGSAAGLRCRTDEPGTIDVDGDCRWLRQTRGAGITLAVLGAASAVVGASLLVIDAQRRRARTATDRAQLRLGFSGGFGGGFGRGAGPRLTLDLRF